MAEPLLAFASDLLAVARRLVPCDSAALLRFEEGALVPLAVDGLRGEAIARRFPPEEHPRLARIVASLAPVRFDDGDLPDPFDGLFAQAGDARSRAHACMGCALVVEGEAIGALTFDALSPGAFATVDPATVARLAAMA
ncbi:MAG: GAF domain-containing protein, partial [Deltaproteobacteria bacterium]|nr:GAF domain-containing protein [Kofleriaceae bacterium]